MMLFRVVLIASVFGVNDLFAVVRVMLTMAEQRAFSAHFSVRNVLRWSIFQTIQSVIVFFLNVIVTIIVIIIIIIIIIVVVIHRTVRSEVVLFHVVFTINDHHKTNNNNNNIGIVILRRRVLKSKNIYNTYLTNFTYLKTSCTRPCNRTSYTIIIIILFVSSVFFIKKQVCVCVCPSAVFQL
jgi:hypothetical protein